jgi:small-conductance mechanosensitive channel
MMERPIRIGDFIETDTIKGTVQSIGARSTIIKTIDNTHFVVPNSSFLEKNLLNWTLSDSIIRSKVNVGVAYGTDVQIVKEILLKIVLSNKDVLKSPEPEILFSDFADSSLNFEVYFWIDLSKELTTREVQSDLRFEIYRIFDERKIEIPFPQRDIHIKTQGINKF